MYLTMLLLSWLQRYSMWHCMVTKQGEESRPPNNNCGTNGHETSGDHSRCMGKLSRKGTSQIGLSKSKLFPKLSCSPPHAGVGHITRMAVQNMPKEQSKEVVQGGESNYESARGWSRKQGRHHWITVNKWYNHAKNKEARGENE
ncbi:hypothetical protein EDD16DRAFT_1524577 [Pisolithus croceorrhizus]|nr:hypothetical protein EDD16DRAFT_1524577 [Pisolithus croceorrhizus]